MKKKVSIVCALLAATMSFTACGKKGDNKFNYNGGSDITDTTAYAVTVDELADTGEDRDCWLSVPESVLVINPFDYDTYSDIDKRQTEFFNRESLSFDVGILDYSTLPSTLYNILGVAAENPYGGYLYANENTEYGWRPDKLFYKAEYDCGLTLNVEDFFYSEQTIVRTAKGNGKPYVYWGSFAASNINNVKMDSSSLMFRRTDGYTVAVATSCSGKFYFFNSEDDLKSGDGKTEEIKQFGIWCFVPDENESAMSLCVGSKGESYENVLTAAKKPFTDNNYNTVKSQQKKYWNEMLAKVPQPQSFELTKIDTKGVTDSNVKEYYYRSWVTVINGVLPANKNFEYKSLSLGKAAMWHEGSSEAKYSCIWESLFGTQMWTFVDPDTAWELCLGQILNIPADGNITGESLPSNKAETVWLCYTAKADKKALADCVEPLERYLNWRYENPRWILNGHNITDEKDADFVSSFLIDLKYMKKICAELGLSDKISYWEEKGASIYNDSLTWFFSGKTPVQYYYAESGTSATGTPLWVDKMLWADEVTGENAKVLLDFTLSQYDKDKAFAGFAGVKYDCFAYTEFALIKYGRADVTEIMGESLLRDIVRSGFIGELYNANSRGCVCEGVRPSLFGAILTIENVWLMNGYMFQDGDISVVNFGRSDVGVKNISRYGKTYDISFDKDSACSVSENGKSEKVTVSVGEQKRVR